ncbi:hypothetical protein RhiirC2_781803 [Rhizophagus irregularis]|uniref:Uncharacterized protein n=1 Tax=Rhizophagus irregularis TaxID=588596 RepID=A0A2N1N4J1_9GLOM|nr:hypothetical protein RhiirC2_781803 [Rhizophagus irregularis]
MISSTDDKIQPICRENNSWKRYELTLNEDDFTREFRPRSSNLQNIELEERSSTKYKTEVKFAHYKKIFDFALQLYEKEKNNTHFVKSFFTKNGQFFEIFLWT